MRREDILSQPPRVLSQAERESYFDEGYLLVERFVPPEWLERLRAAVAGLVERSRAVSVSDSVFDLEPGHRAEAPRLRRVSMPCEQDPVFWEFLKSSAIGDLLADLLGPDVKFFQSKLNFKWEKGGAEVKWHQDVPFFPHTNDAVLTCGVYLYDCEETQGPLKVIPGSHRGPIFDHYDAEGNWSGEIGNDDLPRIPIETARSLPGPAGSVTFHNYRMVHGSEPNRGARGRPLLLNVCSAADAIAYTYNPLKCPHEKALLRGSPAKWAHHEAGHYLIPPDWSGGYTSIFALQQREGKKNAAAE